MRTRLLLRGTWNSEVRELTGPSPYAILEKMYQHCNIVTMIVAREPLPAWCLFASVKRPSVDRGAETFAHRGAGLAALDAGERRPTKLRGKHLKD